jgi:hypothetical protein
MPIQHVILPTAENKWPLTEVRLVKLFKRPNVISCNGLGNQIGIAR